MHRIAGMGFVVEGVIVAEWAEVARVDRDLHAQLGGERAGRPRAHLAGLADLRRRNHQLDSRLLQIDLHQVRDDGPR
jgi:hypothetical protein